MKSIKENMMEESLKILREIGASLRIVQELEKGNVLCTDRSTSELRPVTEDEMKIINKLDSDEVLVYHVIRENRLIGGENMEMIVFLVVFPEETAFYKQKDFYVAYSYVENVTEPLFSEYGTVGIQAIGDFIRRVY